MFLNNCVVRKHSVPVRTGMI